MEQKKITIICLSFPPEVGAAPIRVYHLAKNLLAQGYEVDVIAGMPNYPTGKIFKAYQGKRLMTEDWEGIRVHRFWFWPTNSSSKMIRLISLSSYALSMIYFVPAILRKAKSPLVWVSSPPFLTGLLGLWLAHKKGVKLVLNVSDLWPQSAVDLGFLKPGLLLNLLNKLERKMYQMAGSFTVQSQLIAERITKCQPGKPIFLYRNLQPISSFASMPRPQGQRIIVYAGLLGVAQGVLDIVQKVDFAALGTQLHIYGQGFELDKIQDHLLRHPNIGVTYKGAAPAAAMPEILAQYHATLVPLSADIKGAVPSKIYNAIAHALPILYCGGGEAADIVSSHQIGFVAKPNEVKQLKTHILAITSCSEDDYAHLRSNCIRLAQSTFNKDLQDIQIGQFLEQL